VSVSAETLPGIPTPAGSGHQEEPPLPSLRITPPSISSVYPPLSSPASSRRWLALAVVALLGLGSVGLFWTRREPPQGVIEVARTTEVSVPSVPASVPHPSAANLPPVSELPSAVPVASVAPSASPSAPPPPALPRPLPARPTTPSKPAAPPGGDDLGAYRN
jgi:hypothetical protein